MDRLCKDVLLAGDLEEEDLTTKKTGGVSSKKDSGPGNSSGGTGSGLPKKARGKGDKHTGAYQGGWLRVCCARAPSLSHLSLVCPLVACMPHRRQGGRRRQDREGDYQAHQGGEARRLRGARVRIPHGRTPRRHQRRLQQPRVRGQEPRRRHADGARARPRQQGHARRLQDLPVDRGEGAHAGLRRGSHGRCHRRHHRPHRLHGLRQRPRAHPLQQLQQERRRPPQAHREPQAPHGQPPHRPQGQDGRLRHPGKCSNQ